MILNLLLPFLATLATGLGPLSMHSSSNIAIDDCEIVEFYERIELDRGAKIIGAYGGVEEGEAVLVPTEVESWQLRGQCAPRSIRTIIRLKGPVQSLKPIGARNMQLTVSMPC